MKKYPLHVQILLGMVFGTLFSIIFIQCNLPIRWILDYIKPIGAVFVNSLKMVAIPLIFSLLLVCIASVQDTKKISRMGIKAISIYAITTIISGGLGILMTNILKPGAIISEQTRNALLDMYQPSLQPMQPQVKSGPMQWLVNIVPENLFHPFSSNDALLQVVFLAVFLGIALLKTPEKNRNTILSFFEGIRDTIIACINMIMHIAPLGVFALTTALFVESTQTQTHAHVVEIIYALLGYLGTVIGGLFIILLVLYPIMLKIFSSMCCLTFFKGIYPAQLLAFSSSSSSVALPISIQRAQSNLGLSKEVSNFILPLGATINMNGTALYQAVICIFVAQAMNIELSVTKQLIITGNIALSSLGVASAPGASLVVTMLLLESLGIPAAGLGLVLAPDRILDMCRTVVNITGDALTAVIVSEGEKHERG